MIAFEDFAKVDLRVAKITQAEDHPNADRLLKLQLDDGSGTPRQICAGIKEHYNPDQLVGKQIVIVRLRGVLRHRHVLDGARKSIVIAHTKTGDPARQSGED